MTPLRIVADENIPYVVDAFSTLGEVRTVAGRRVGPDDVRDADLLLVRSVTKVDAALLDGSAVRFVATATIGLDHLDLDYLARRGIAYASAPGSNANSVAEYIACALLALARRTGRTLRGMTAGVVGVGNVGSRVVEKLRALGLQVIKNDPPLQRRTGDESFRPLDEIFEADVVTAHVPLTREGPDATFHLIDDAFLRRLKPDAFLFNTSRGAVADTAALLEYAGRSDRGPITLDVWENEPTISCELLARVDLATPHIAGYSFDGKVKGCWMIYEAACRFLGVEPAWSMDAALPPPELPEIDVSRLKGDPQDVLRQVCAAVYDIEADDARLRRLLRMEESERGAYFDRLRKEYPRRREFPNTRVVGAEGELAAALQGLGFRV